jgi:hypothetical protein
MALSTLQLQTVYNVIAAQGIPDPRGQASGYGEDLGLNLGSRVMADLICERFNWRFNRGVAAPIYTNSWQQDYPQPAQLAGPIEWGDDCDIVNINSTTIPKPLNWDGAITWVRGLTRTSIGRYRPGKICWMYNWELSWGTWPGANTVFHPLVTTGAVGQNPIMNFIDSNGNYLILTTFGTTGLTAPAAALAAVEGTLVPDGTCVWTVVAPTSQGFRLDVLPGAAGPVFQILPYYQLAPPLFTTFAQLLTPIPDSFSRHFQTGLEAYCLKSSPNPADRPRGDTALKLWMMAMEAMMKQGDKEQNAYGMIPQNQVPESRWGWKGPFTADQPY